MPETPEQERQRNAEQSKRVQRQALSSYARALGDRPVPPCPRCGAAWVVGSPHVGMSYVACTCGKIFPR